MLFTFLMVAAISAEAQIALTSREVPGRSRFTALENHKLPRDPEIDGKDDDGEGLPSGSKRILFLTGGFRGLSVGPEGDVLAGKIEQKMREAGHSVELVKMALPEGLPYGRLSRLPALLEKFHPAYVFYFFGQPEPILDFAALDQWVDRSATGQVVATHFFSADSQPVKFLTWLLFLEEPHSEIFLRDFNLQAGQIALGQKLRWSDDSELDLLRPTAEVMLRAQSASAASGAKFYVIWAGGRILPVTWTAHLLPGPRYWVLRMLELLKTRFVVSSTHILKRLGDLGVPVVANDAAAEILQTARLDENSNTREYAKSDEVTDKLAAELSTTIWNSIH